MRIAFWCFGHLYPDATSADGTYLINWSLVGAMKKLGHEVIFIGPIKPKDAQKDSADYPDSLYRLFNKVLPTDYSDVRKNVKKYAGVENRTHQWWKNEIEHIQYPKNIDCLFLEAHNVLGTQYLAASATRFYSRLNKPCYIVDTDNWARSNAPLLPYYGINQKMVYFLTPYPKKKFPQQIEFYYGFDKDLALDKFFPKYEATPFAYVGNNYKREKKFIKFYKDINAHIYGNFKRDKNNIKQTIGEKKFKGQVIPGKVTETLKKYYACIHITRPDYEKIGLQAPRINECAHAGTICFIDRDIKHQERWTLKDQFVSSSKEAQDKLNSFIRNKEITQRIYDHRKMLITYEQQLPKILGKIK